MRMGAESKKLSAGCFIRDIQWTASLSIVEEINYLLYILVSYLLRKSTCISSRDRDKDYRSIFVHYLLLLLLLLSLILHIKYRTEFSTDTNMMSSIADKY